MTFQENLAVLRSGGQATFPEHANSLEFARSMDAEDSLRHLRGQYIVPTKASIRKRKLGCGEVTSSNGNGAIASIAKKMNGTTLLGTNKASGMIASETEKAIYFCGNSLGLQPKATRRFIDAQLETWASIGVQGHFVDIENSPLVAWQDMAEDCSKRMSALVGASPSEVVAMNTLTVNLHMLMASFYKPTKSRHKIIAEWKPFPSDYYAFESQLKWHGLEVATSLIELQPDANLYISTEKILSTIDAHADDTALILLPGLQYYSGQLFDIQRITAHARSKGIVVGWDLAHAVGNVELRLHDWDVDFAVWCTYKYLNAGPGAIAGAFVHDRHGKVERADGDSGCFEYHPRLSGWYGGDKSVRFNMAKTFQPTPGAQGFQVSNPSAVDLASLSASLSVFEKTSIRQLRDKSLVLTAYAETLLNRVLADHKEKTKAPDDDVPPFRIITPSVPAERGAQLSVLLKPGILQHVSTALEEAGVILDQRKPDVIRIAPVPMYNTYEEVWTVVNILHRVVST